MAKTQMKTNAQKALEMTNGKWKMVNGKSFF